MTKRTLAGVSLAICLLAASREASAVPVGPTDFDSWVLGAPFAGPLTDVFDAAVPPPGTIGSLTNNVYFDSATGNYTYVELVTPSINSISEFNTSFGIRKFTGVAGYSFTQATAAGTGFSINHSLLDGTLDWGALVDDEWNAGEAITFFYVSAGKPRSSILDTYQLINSEVGTAPSFVPTPEPGSMLLLGSGLAGLYATVRRRRALKR